MSIKTISVPDTVDLCNRILESQERIERLLMGNSQPRAEQRNMLTLEQAAEYLGISRWTLYGKTGEKNKEIPSSKRGRRCYFKIEDLDRWMSNTNQKEPV